MAGDWIKMRSDLLTHPKVVRIASALKADKLRVIGGLHATWCLFDVHSTDGVMEGYSPEVLDSHLGWDGFSEAMISVKWLENTGESLATPRFDEHNGQSAKRRATEAERKRLAREGGKMSASDADELRTREEKRREEKSKPTNSKELESASDADDAKNPTCPHQEIIAIYHEVLPQCPKVRDWTPARAAKLRARWNEEPRRQNLEYWRTFFEYVAKCDFLVGKSGGNRPFMADLSWIVKSDNFVKIREGKYAND